MKIKILLVILILIIFGSVSWVSAMTDQEKQDLISQIRQQLAQLQSQLVQALAQQQGGQGWCHTFNSNLGTANYGDEVMALHIALQQQGISFGTDDIQTYSTGTISAVAQFQEKYASDILYPAGLSRGTGYVGNATRRELNIFYGCSSATNNNTNNNYNNTNNTTDTTNTNNCKAACSAQSDGTFTIDCSGNVTKCSSGNICQLTYDTSYTYNNGAVQTIKNLTGAQCSSQNSSCTPQWSCSGFGSCINGRQTQTCYDSNNCGVTTGEPATSQSCSLTCNPIWNCSGFYNSACINGQQTQTCYDSNNCGVTENEPALTQNCTSTINTNNCNASCITNPNGTIWSTDCNQSNPRQCTGGDVCQLTYSTQNNVVNGTVQTIKTLTGSECTSTPTVVNNNCTPQWNCSGFGSCVNGQQTQTCTDSNSCGDTSNEPPTSQSCTVVCNPNWQCGNWGDCVNSTQLRTCSDLSNCGVTNTTYPVSQSCTPQPVVTIKANSVANYTTISDTSSVSLSWTSSNVDSCVASGAWSGTKSTSGNEQSPRILGSMQFIITCTGAYGTASSTVNVISTAATWVDLKINGSDMPLSIDNQTQITLKWTTKGVSSCVASSSKNDWTGSLNSSGTKNLTIPASGYPVGFGTYRVTCKDSHGISVADAGSVNITAADPQTSFLNSAQNQLASISAAILQLAQQMGINLK